MNTTKTLLLLICLCLSCFIHADAKSEHVFQTKPTSAIQTKNPTVKVRTQEYTVPAALAWTYAKSKGFKFYPDGARGAKLGTKDWGLSYYRDKNNREQTVDNTSLLTAGISMQVQRLVGSMIDEFTGANFIRSHAKFHFFDGRRLKSGWTVKAISFGGSYDIEISPRGDNAHTLVKVEIISPSSRGAATFKNIVLVGPAGSNWRQAFDR